MDRASETVAMSRGNPRGAASGWRHSGRATPDCQPPDGTLERKSPKTGGVRAPDHTTVSRRSADLAVAAALTSTGGPVGVVAHGPDAEVIIPPRAGAVPSDTAGESPSHLRERSPFHRLLNDDDVQACSVTPGTLSPPHRSAYAPSPVNTPKRIAIRFGSHVPVLKLGGVRGLGR
ncbi:hypothetical protein GCM10022293_45910 [Azospirillum formosense]